MTATVGAMLSSRKRNANAVLATERFRSQVALLAERLKRPLEEVTKEASEGMHEIASVQHPAFAAMFDHGLGPMHTRAFTIDVDQKGMKAIKRLDKDHALVFLPTHRSYADAFILTQTLREAGMPRNFILGGNNLGFFPLGTIIRRSGGVLMRRSFQDDEVYKFVVREYLGYLAAQGHNLEWYMEGGRSRTGKLRPPKYGLLRYLVDAIESGVADDMLLVPVAITYDQLHEIGMMAAEEAGAQKAKEGLRWLADYARMQRKWIGTAYVRFGEPLSLKEALRRADAERGSGRWTVEKIAFEVFSRINGATPVTAPALVTLALLGVGDRGLTLGEAHRSSGHRRRPTGRAGIEGASREEGSRRAQERHARTGREGGPHHFLQTERQATVTTETIMQGAEPFFYKGNDIGVLVCHGFTGTTQSMRGLGQRLNAAGYTTIGPRLKGHGVSPQAMARATASDWIASVDEALAELRKTCAQVFMTGLSMGGTLTLYAAAKYADVLKGAITINAPVQLDVPDLAGLALESAVPEMIPGVGSDIKAPGVTELAYAEVPVAALRQIYALCAVTRDLLPRVKCPTLVMQSRDDHIVNPSNGPRIVELLGKDKAELLWLDNSFHVATLDNDKDLIGERAAACIKGIAGR